MTAVHDWGVIGPDSSDAELARAAAAGDRRAFAGIYDRYADRLHDFCAGMLADRDAAADCVQDAFCEAATCLRDLREPDKLRAWLYGIARHRCLRRLRDRRREQPTDAVPEVVSGDDAPDTMASRIELAELIAEAAGGLTDRDRSVLELSYRHGLDGPELAEALGVTQTNAYTMVYRLRDAMERCLGALLVCRGARINQNRCPELAVILDGWDGRFTILLRKRAARHIDGCGACEQERRERLNPVALLGATPVFLRAPDGLRDQTLSRIQLTSAGRDMTADATSGHGSSPDAELTERMPLPVAEVTERLPMPASGAAMHNDIDAPTERVAFAAGSAEERDEQSRSRLLLVGLLCIIPLVALGLTILVLYPRESAVAPSGGAEKTPTVTNGNPPGPPPAATPSNTPPTGAPASVGTAGTRQPAQPGSLAPGAVLPSQPSPTVVESDTRQRTMNQSRTQAPPPPVQRRVPAPAPPAEPDPIDAAPANLPPPTPEVPVQQAPAPDPLQPPVPLEDQARIQERHSPPAEDSTTTVPYPR